MNILFCSVYPPFQFKLYLRLITGVYTVDAHVWYVARGEYNLLIQQNDQLL